MMAGAHLQANITNSSGHLEEEEVEGDFLSAWIKPSVLESAELTFTPGHAPGLGSGPIGFNSLSLPNGGHAEFCTFVYGQLPDCSDAAPSLLPLWCAVSSWLPF